MTIPAIIPQPLGGSSLAIAAQRGLAREWYAERPGGVEAWRRHLQNVVRPHQTGAWLRSLEPALAPSGNAALRLRRVAELGGAVVSTGQQAALFGGPVYTLNKALSALALADALEHETGIPTVPVFWAATDDADFEEACWTAVAVTGGTRVLQLTNTPRPGVPMSRVRLRHVEPLLDVLATASGSMAEPRPLALARRAFVTGQTLGNAYLQLLRELFAPLGIAVLDASHPAVRESAAPVLRRALERAPDLARALGDRYESILAAGHAPQVEHLPELTLVFADGSDGEKQRVPVREASRYLDSAPAALGPNVLLRPVIERFIMPSACYVAGPGELAYFAQVGVVATTLEVPAPIPVPRWSALIVEPRIERLLDRLGVARDDLRDRQRVETRLARENIPAPIADALEALRRDIAGDVDALRSSDRDKLVPEASLEGVRHWVEHRIDRLARRYAAAVKRHETQMMQDIATAAAALYPNGRPQERVLNFIPFWARYGGPLIDALRAGALEHARSLIGATASEPMPERV